MSTPEVARYVYVVRRIYGVYSSKYSVAAVRVSGGVWNAWQCAVNVGVE